MTSARGREVVPALPAEIEGGGILLGALGALHRRAGRAGGEVFVDERLGAPGLGILLDPHLRQRRLDRELAGEARGIRVEDAGANAAMAEQVDEELRLREVGRGVDALQNFTEAVSPAPSSLMPERDWMLYRLSASAKRGITYPLTPPAQVTKSRSGLYAGRS